jgi:hypothetical protein
MHAKIPIRMLIYFGLFQPEKCLRELDRLVEDRDKFHIP